MIKVAFVGWRGMVGSVLMKRMLAENGFHGFEPIFMTTSQVGQKGPAIGRDIPPLKDAKDIGQLKSMDVIVTCQGSNYSQSIYPQLKKAGWNGYWIDAASAFRMQDDSVIILDPVNRPVIDAALHSGTRRFIGGNCTVSLMLMAIGGLFQKGYVEWLTSMTYQAASGAGAKNMRELVSQMAAISDKAQPLLNDPGAAIQRLDQVVQDSMLEQNFPCSEFGAPLAGSALPWIDVLMEEGQTREEWKGFAETNKILQNNPPVPIDGICVRIGAMRCHCQAMTFKLTRDIPMDEIEAIVAQANDWVRLVPNTKKDTLEQLTPAAVTGKLDIPVGRLHKMNLGPRYLTAFTVGDQLLWGAAEPIRRMLEIVLQHLTK